ncbi:hypothetical protein C8R43DRAFT_968388 [Mycena crocata]|nr:hypothetical protein C8R43DRAFT_968388 [Mycena crocata]
MLMNSVIPLKTPRLITLFLAWVWAIIALGVEINALAKSNKDKTAITDEIPPPTKVSLDTSDVFQSAAVVTTVTLIILALSTLYILLLVIDSNSRSGISTRTLPLQYFSLAFLALWLFAVQIPLSVFVSQRSIKVAASIGGVTIQDGVLKTIERALGAKTAYKDYYYLKLLAILPWFLFLFTLAAAVVGFLASSYARGSAATGEPVSSEKGAPALNGQGKAPVTPAK